MTYDLTGLPDTFLTATELQYLLDQIAERKPRRIVEFGVQAGRNPAAILRNFDFVESYVGIDVTPDHVTQMTCQRKEVPKEAGVLAKHDSRFRVIVRPLGTLELSAADIGEADFFIIDGDHSALGVSNDRALALSAAAPGALILYHDDNGRPEVQVTQTLQLFRTRFGATIKHIEGTWWAQEVVE